MVTQYFNHARMTELILYIATRHEGDERFGKTRLTKLLFRADFEWFRRTGRPIAGGVYIKMRYGPMLPHLDEHLYGMEQRDLLHIETRPGGGWTEPDRPVPHRDGNTSLFEPEQLALVDKLIRDHWRETANRVSDLSHEFIGWRVGHWREPIPYGTAWLSTPEPTDAERERAAALAARLGRT